MKNMIKKTLQGLLIVPALVVGVSLFAPVAQPVGALGGALGIDGGASAAKSDDQKSCLFGTETGCNGSGVFKNITNVLLFLIGAISVIMLIVGGIRYTVSGGDSGAVTSAKNTILYALVGIVVALLAYALVNFVVGSFVKP